MKLILKGSAITYKTYTKTHYKCTLESVVEENALISDNFHTNTDMY